MTKGHYSTANIKLYYMLLNCTQCSALQPNSNTNYNGAIFTYFSDNDVNRTSPMRTCRSIKTCRSIHIDFKYVVVFRNLKGHSGAHYKSDQQHIISNLCALCWPQCHGLVWTAGMTCTMYPGDTDHSAPSLLMDGWMANRTQPAENNMNGWMANWTQPAENNIDGWMTNRTQPVENNMDGRMANRT